MVKAALLLASIALAAPVPSSGAADQDARLATAALITALGNHRLVAIGESHGSARFHAFLQALLRRPAFVCRLDDVVVEFGNAHWQRLADRYISGRTVPRRDKVRIWRDTGQFLVWDSPLYEAVFDRIRAINQKHFCPRPIRVVLGDPPIPWERVLSAADYRQYADRDQSFADIVEREVLEKGHRALLVVGAAHILKGHPRQFTGSATAAETIAARHPGELFSLLPISDPALIAMLGAPLGRVAALGDTGIAGQSYRALAPAGAFMKVTENGQATWRAMNTLDWPAAEKVVDAVIALPGPDRKVPPEPATYREATYVRELHRRAAILSQVYGGDFEAQLEQALRAADLSPG